jgi:hypothetical protein
MAGKISRVQKITKKTKGSEDSWGALIESWSFRHDFIEGSTTMLHRQFLLRFALVSASAAASLALAHPAFAQFVINEPTVEKGELEFETHGSFQSGFPDEDEKNAKETDEEEAPGADEEEEPFTRHGHEIEMGYGLTDFWKLELGLGLQQPVDGDLQATTFEIENTLQLATYELWGAVFSAFASVELGLADQIPDAVEFGPLVQFGNDKLTLVLNALFEKTFGEFREPGIGFEYAAQLKFAMTDRVSAGFEAFGEIEDLRNVPSFHKTEFRIGPVIYVSTPENEGQKAGGDSDDERGLSIGGRDIGIAADVGLLVGATAVTPDLAVKWDLSISF